MMLSPVQFGNSAIPKPQPRFGEGIYGYSQYDPVQVKLAFDQDSARQALAPVANAGQSIGDGLKAIAAAITEYARGPVQD